MSVTLSNLTMSRVSAGTSGSTPPAGDPYWSSVSLLTETTSTNTQNNNVFLDSSTNNFTVSAAGSLTQGSFSPFAVANGASYSAATNGGSAGSFANGQLTFTEQTISGDFTAECWFYRTGDAAAYSIIFAGSNVLAGGSQNCQLYVGNDGSVTLILAATAIISNAGTAVTAGAWHHIVWVKSGTSAAIFVNGIRVGTGTTSANLMCAAISGGNASASYYAQGYLSDCRIVNSAVYNPSNSTITVPTAPLTAITNTSLLLNFTNAGIYDAAAENNMLTVADAQVSTTQAKFGTTSMKFDGTGDNVSMPSSSNFDFGSGDFTIESWIYVSSYVTSSAIISKGSNGPFLIFLGEQNEIAFYSSTNGSSWAVADLRIATSYATNTWHHIAVTRSGSTVRTFFNGVLANSTTLTGAVFSNSTDVSVGRYTNTFDGYIQDLRVTKGVARYTANFAAPTEPFPTN